MKDMLTSYNPRIVRYDYVLGQKPEGAIHLGITASVGYEGATHFFHTIHALVGTPKAVIQLEGRLALTSDTCQRAEKEFQLQREAEEKQEFSKLFGIPIKILDTPLQLEFISMTGGLREGDGQLLRDGFESLRKAALGISQKNHHGKYVKVDGYRVEASSARAYIGCIPPLQQLNIILKEKIKELDNSETNVKGTMVYKEEFLWSSVSRNPERL